MEPQATVTYFCHVDLNSCCHDYVYVSSHQSSRSSWSSLTSNQFQGNMKLKLWTVTLCVACGVMHMVFPNVWIFFPQRGFFSTLGFFPWGSVGPFPHNVYLGPTPILFVHLFHIMCQLYVCNPVVPGSLWFIVLFHNASCSRAQTTQHQCQSMGDGWVCGAWT